MVWSRTILFLTLDVTQVGAQSTSDPYKVNSSAGTVVGAPQPPPGSDLFNLSRDLYKLQWAKENIQALQAGLPLQEFNEYIENSTYGKVMRAIETHLPAAQVAEGALVGILPESPIVEFYRKLTQDIQNGRRSLAEPKPIQDQPVEQADDPFARRQELVKRVMEKQGVPTAAISLTREDLYQGWLAAVNKKIGEVEKEIATAAKISEVPGRSAGLSIDIDKIFRGGDLNAAGNQTNGQGRDGTNPPPVTQTDEGVNPPAVAPPIPTDGGVNPPAVAPPIPTDGQGVNPPAIAPPDNQPPPKQVGDSTTTASNGWCNGDLALCQSWQDGGDRGAFGDPANADTAATAAAAAARQQFYDQNPQLKQFHRRLLPRICLPQPKSTTPFRRGC